nr:unnamed protein product [Callosobruchus analis]
MHAWANRSPSLLHTLERPSGHRKPIPVLSVNKARLQSFAFHPEYCLANLKRLTRCCLVRRGPVAGLLLLKFAAWKRLLTVRSEILTCHTSLSKSFTLRLVVVLLLRTLRSSPMPSLSWSSYISCGLPKTSHSSYDRCVMRA